MLCIVEKESNQKHKREKKKFVARDISNNQGHFSNNQ
jgi:hypothetical protein